MSRNTRFMWYILAALLFCAVTYGGCGGSDNLASVNTSGGGTSQPVSGDTSGRGDWEDWETIDSLSVLENTWRITDVDLQTDADWYLLTSNIENSTVKITVSDRTKRNVGKVNLSKSLLCEFYIVDENGTQTAFERLMPNGETFYTLSDNGFTTLPDAISTSFTAEVQNNGKTLIVTSDAPNRLGGNKTYTIVTTMEAVY